MSTLHTYTFAACETCSNVTEYGIQNYRNVPDLRQLIWDSSIRTLHTYTFAACETFSNVTEYGIQNYKNVPDRQAIDGFRVFKLQIVLVILDNRQNPRGQTCADHSDLRLLRLL